MAAAGVETASLGGVYQAQKTWATSQAIIPTEMMLKSAQSSGGNTTAAVSSHQTLDIFLIFSLRLYSPLLFLCFRSDVISHTAYAEQETIVQEPSLVTDAQGITSVVSGVTTWYASSFYEIDASASSYFSLSGVAT